MTRALAAAALLAAALTVSGCSSLAPATRASADGPVRIVAAENFWGSLARQLGGSRATVTSLVNRPGADPHDYEPTAKDARAVADAQLVVINGVGYDPWAGKLLSTRGTGRRVTLDVGELVGARPGDNPHRWYDPADVDHVIAAISADLQRIDPADGSYFAAQKQRLETLGLADYHRLIDHIRTAYAGTPVGASESIFAAMAPALGLELVTPTRFMNAISEGAEPAAGDKTEVDKQIRARAIKVFVYNAQNTTPDVRALVTEARRAGVEVTTVTETLTPSGATFQQWQVAQLRRLSEALAKATGR